MPRQRLNRRVNGQVLLWALAVILLDTASKWWVRRSLGSGPRHVWGPLWLRVTYNGGISFSFNRSGPVVTTLVVLIIVVATMFVALRATPGLATVGWGLLLGGGVSNEFDRLAHVPHQVTDFISVGWFPVFNVADAGVTAGFCLLVLALARGSALVRR